MKRITDFRTLLCMLLPLCMFALLPIRLIGQDWQSVQLSSVENTNSCAPSNNGTGHMICIQISPNNATGVAWVPGGFPGAQPTLRNGNPTPGYEPQGTIDTPLPLGVPALAGQVNIAGTSCVPANDGTGNVICLVSLIQYPPNSVISNGFLYGIAFNPAPPTSNSGWVLLGTGYFSTPSCAATQFPAGKAICVVKINDELEGIAFSPGTSATAQSTTGLVPLPFGSGFTDPDTGFGTTPSCTIGNQGGNAMSANNGGTVAICTIVQNGNLVGFAFDPRTGYTSLPTPQTLLIGQTTPVGPSIVASSCATPPNNSVSGNPGTSPQVICAASVLVGPSLIQAVAFDPVGGTQSSPFGYGVMPSQGFGGGVSCTASNSANITYDDATNTVGVGGPTFQNTVDCAITNGSTLTAMEIDPRVGAANWLAPIGPLIGGMTTSTIWTPYCLRLNVDVNGFACGMQADFINPSGPTTTLLQIGLFVHF